MEPARLSFCTINPVRNALHNACRVQGRMDLAKELMHLVDDDADDLYVVLQSPQVRSFFDEPGADKIGDIAQWLLDKGTPTASLFLEDPDRPGSGTMWVW